MNIPPPPPGFVLEGQANSAPPPQRQQPSYNGPSDAASLMPALIAQESGGRAGVLGPMTQYGQAIGRTQMLPATAREMAQKIGLPYDESLLRGTSPEAAAYQDRLGQAYLEQGLQETGNVRDALRYYHGGPNRDLWGPKTNAYADQVIGRLNGGQVEPMQQMASVEPPPPPQGFQIEAPGQTQAPAQQMAQTGPKVWDQLSPEERMSLGRGDQVQLPTGEIVTLSGSPFVDQNQRGSDRSGGQGIFLREPNATDTAAAFGTAFSEQIPFGDELVAAGAGLLSGRGYDAIRQQQMQDRQFFNETNGGARDAGGLAGFAAGFALPGGKWVEGATGAARAGRAAALGAGYSGLYGAGNTDGSFIDRLAAGGTQAALGAGAGAVLQRGADAFGAAAASARANPSAARQLSAAGVDLTPGQMLGGAAQRIEDAATSVPILGDAIRNARIRGLESFNTAAINQALEPIGAKATRGRQGIAQADRAVSQAYDNALQGVIVPRDGAFDAQITQIARSNPLPGEMQGEFSALLNNTLNRIGQGMDGQSWKQLDSEIGAAVRSAQSGSQTNPAQRLMADKLMQVQDAVRGMLSRANPTVADEIARANEAAAGMYRVRDASQGLGTAARDGLFTPGDLNRAVRAGDSSAGNRQYARGEAMMQGLSDAAAQVLPSTVPDSGTAIRSLFTVAPAIGAGAGAGAVGVPLAAPAAVATGAGLFGGASAYSRPVQGALNRVYRASTPGAARQALADFQKLAAQSPVLQPVYEALQSALRPLLLGGPTATPTTP